jgi:hypothetical protein
MLMALTPVKRSDSFNRTKSDCDSTAGKLRIPVVAK